MAKIIVDTSTNEILIPFDLTEDCTVTAMLCNKSGNIITPIFEAKRYLQGKNFYRWDKRDILGNIVPSGKYSIVFTTSNLQAEWEGVVGNTSLAKSGIRKHGGYLFYTDVAIFGDMLFLCNDYNESRPKQFRVNVNNPQDKDLAVNGFYTTPDTHRLCTDGQRVYYMARGGSGQGDKSFIFAVNTADWSLYNFSAGTQIDLAFLWQGSYSAVGIEDTNNETNKTTFTDIAVQPAGNFLFKIVGGRGEVMAYNKNTGAYIKTTSLPGCKRASCDNTGNLWVSFTNQVIRYAVAGDTTLTPGLTIAGFSSVKDVCPSVDGSKVLVTEGGTVDQVKTYSATDGSLLNTTGVLGGYSNGEAVADDKFYFVNNGSIAVHGDGSMWVLDDGNNRIQQFAANKNYITSIMYLPTVYDLALDANNANRLLIGFQEFLIDYSKPLAGTNGSWKLVKNWGYNIPAYNYPQHLVSVSDRSYVICYNPDSSKYEVLELKPGAGIRKTTTAITNAEGIQLLYPDGIWSMDRGSNLPGATVTWYLRPLLSVNGSGNPVFGPKEIAAQIQSKEVTDPNYSGDGQNACFGERIGGDIISFEGSDGNYTFQCQGWHLGAIPYGGTAYKWKAAYQTGKNYYGRYPKDGRYDNGNGSNYPGSKAKAVADMVIMGQRLSFWKGGDGNEYKMYYKNGAFLSGFGTNIQEIRAAGGDPSYPGMAINAFAMHAAKIGPNVYLYHGDEGVNFGAHRWKITGYDTIQTFSLPVTITATAPAISYPLVYDLMEALPVQDNIVNVPGFTTRLPLTNGEANDGHFDASLNYQLDYNNKTYYVGYRAGQSAPYGLSYLRQKINVPAFKSWRLSLFIAIESVPSDREATAQDYNSGRSSGSGLAFVLRDTSGKAILKVDRVLSFPDGIRSQKMIVNNTTIAVQSDFVESLYYPIEISYAKGKLQAVFNGNTPVIVDPYEAGVNPETIGDYGFEGFYSGSGFQNTTGTSIQRLKLYGNNESIVAKKNTQKTFENATGDELSQAQLNTTYPGVLIGSRIFCANINLVYEKKTSTSWVSYPYAAVS